MAKHPAYDLGHTTAIEDLATEENAMSYDFRNMNDNELNKLGIGYTKDFSEKGFWDKLRNVVGKVGKNLLEPVLKLYYAALDQDTPTWAKTVMIGALGYFISPIDLIPDVIPVIGYADDAAVIAAAVATVAAHIKEDHAKKARETCRQWFGKSL